MGYNKILIIDDSVTITSVLKMRLVQTSGFEIMLAHTYAQAYDILNESSKDFFLAIVDLTLPDATNGEAVDITLAAGIPTVVMTGNYRDDQRVKYSEKNIVDYVLKDSPWNLEYIVTLARRVYKNQWIGVLVVDDSKMFRHRFKKLLQIHNYQILEARHGQEALDILKKRPPNLSLVLTDYNMPVMDGFELVPEIRKLYSKDEVAIIGLSGEEDRSISAHFLKIGANDFLSKSFSAEEFYARLSQNVENLELIRGLKDAAMKDHLTGVFNRRYFFSQSDQLRKAAEKKGYELQLAMIDIDFFKKVNDTYGHHVGDVVIVDCATRIKEAGSGGFLDSVPARFGGEEFVILVADKPGSSRLCQELERLRSAIEKSVKHVDGQNVTYTISIGVSVNASDQNLDEIIKIADDNLYKAKESGRNKIVVS